MSPPLFVGKRWHKLALHKWSGVTYKSDLPRSSNIRSSQWAPLWAMGGAHLPIQGLTSIHRVFILKMTHLTLASFSNGIMSLFIGKNIWPLENGRFTLYRTSKRWRTNISLKNLRKCGHFSTIEKSFNSMLYHNLTSSNTPCPLRVDWQPGDAWSY